MYRVGSLFYAIYFFVSFPVFFKMDEEVQIGCSMRTAACESLASGMLVTIILDFWRLTSRGFSSDSSTVLTWFGVN